MRGAANAHVSVQLSLTFGVVTNVELHCSLPAGGVDQVLASNLLADPSVQAFFLSLSSNKTGASAPVFVSHTEDISTVPLLIC